MTALGRRLTPLALPAPPALPVLPALLLCLVATTACNPKPPDETDYVKRIAAARADKDTFFQTSSDSPVSGSQKAALLPLVYYPVDPSFNVPAALKPSDDRTTIMMPT